MCRRNPAQGRGAYRDRHERGLGGGGRGAHRREKLRRAGDRERERPCQRQVWVRVRPNRVVLTPGVCASSLAVMCAVQPDTRISHPQGDGGNSASLPGESTTYAVPTTAQGRPDVWLHLYAAVQIFVATFRTVDRGCQPAPGLPCALFQSRVRYRGKARAKCAARMRRCVWEAVGWVEHLRNPSFSARGSVDGFRFALPILRSACRNARRKTDYASL